MIRTKILQWVIIGSDIDLIKKRQNFFIFNAKMIKCLIDDTDAGAGRTPAGAADGYGRFYTEIAASSDWGI